MALRGEYGGDAKLDMVVQLDAVFSYGWLDNWQPIQLI
jgi:hypothetical protein